MPTDMAEEKNERKLLSDAILVAAASAFSYALAYAYQSGFASYFSLPPLLLTPTLGAVFQAGAVVGTFLLFFWNIFNAVWMFIRTNSGIGRSILRLLLITLMAVMFVFVFSNKWGWLIIVAVFCVFGFGEFIFPRITQREIAGYENKLLAQEKIKSASKPTFLHHLGQRFGDRVILPVIAAFGLLLLANGLGNKTAKEQEDFLYWRTRQITSLQLWTIK
jgi:hypothetical protein